MLYKKKWVWVILGILFVIGSLVMGFEIRYGKRIYSGISVVGIGLGGMNINEAKNVVQEKLGKINQIKLVWGTNNWSVNYADIGVFLKTEETVDSAMRIGRSGNVNKDLRDKLVAMRTGIKVNPVFAMDESSLSGAIASIAAEINIPAQEPEVTYDPVTGKVDVTAGENGQEVDLGKLIHLIKANISEVRNSVIEIPVIALKPQLSSQQLERAKARAQGLVGKKLTVNFSDGEMKWDVDSVQLMTWVDPSTDSAWKRVLIEAWVTQLAQAVDRTPQNASFQFVSAGRVQEFKPAKEGWKINQPKAVQDILLTLNKLNADEQMQVIEIAVDKVDPIVKNSEVNNLGIKELLGRGESWFSGSIDNRIFNLEKATGVLNGILVAPGEIFSFNQALGEVSAKTGYKQAYVISQGKTVLGDGGGVCQTSTTMFRAVLAAGLPITERTAHAYRVSYYEEKYQPGFDATVFQPNPDFKFVNDTPAYLLIQTSVDPVAKKLVYDIYGTSDGRKAEISKARVWDVTAPPPDLYQDDPTLPVGVVRQTEHAAWGAKVAFDWKVTRGEEILQQRTFYSSYTPWQAVYLRGTKI